MEKRFLQILCVLNFAYLIYGLTGNVEDRAYDLRALIEKNVARYENSLRAKKYNLFQGFNLPGIDGEWKFKPIGNLLENSSKCLGDISYILKNIRSPWAWKLFDSFGKPEAGILDGNTKWLGGYNECLNFTSINPNSSTIGNFRGKYCMASFNLQIQQMALPLSSAICIPDSCSPEEAQGYVKQLMLIAGTLPLLNGNRMNVTQKLNITFPNDILQCKPRERNLNNAAIAVIFVLSFFFVLTMIGSSMTAFKYFKTIIEGYDVETIVDRNQLVTDHNGVSKANDNSAFQDESKDTGKIATDNSFVKMDTFSPSKHTFSEKKSIMDTLEAFLQCFCVFTNGSKILNTNTSEGELLCIHGIRFLSMCWVILGHAYLFGVQQMRNVFAVMEYIDTFLFQIILQGFYSVDSFFVLSGFLLAYLSMNEFSKPRGSISWPYFYVHRYIRLTPVYTIVLGFYATVYLYMGSGPYWPDYDIDPNCQKHWWQNLLYINNFWDQSDQCMGHAWYLANDMQFFIISPLFLITLHRFPLVGYALIAIFMLACWFSNFFITYHFELMAGVFNVSQAASASLVKFMDYFNKIYIKPYTRISPYLIGIVTGYLLHKRKEKNYPRHSLVFMCVGWALSAGIGLICVFVLYHQNPPLIGNSFYNAFNRTAFGLSLAWVIYACLVGQGGFVNGILSYKFFIPLSRLTYAAYLIHPMIITGYFASMKTSMEFNNTTFFYLFLGFLVTTYAASLPVALMLESPVIALEKWIRKSFTKRHKNETVN